LGLGLSIHRPGAFFGFARPLFTGRPSLYP
jgi:hypothetical protein